MRQWVEERTEAAALEQVTSQHLYVCTHLMLKKQNHPPTHLPFLLRLCSRQESVGSRAETERR